MNQLCEQAVHKADNSDGAGPVPRYRIQERWCAKSYFLYYPLWDTGIVEIYKSRDNQKHHDLAVKSNKSKRMIKQLVERRIKQLVEKGPTHVENTNTKGRAPRIREKHWVKKYYQKEPWVSHAQPAWQKRRDASCEHIQIWRVKGWASGSKSIHIAVPASSSDLDYMST